MSDRKYKHQGYQDGGGFSYKSRTNQGPRPETPREPMKERMEGAPRGRTAGGFGPEVFRCNGCGELQHGLGEVVPGSTCARCSADLHTCSNCRFFDATTLWECRENIPARVSGKHKNNECALFQPKIVKDLVADKGRSNGPQNADDARKAFDALFKK